MSENLCDIAVIGLAVMGQNLVLNFEEKGYSVAVFNRTEEKTRQFLQSAAAGKKIAAPGSIVDLIAALKRPRKVLMMVKAGEGVDDLIAQLTPHLEPGDILIDGGNSHYRDTERRCEALRQRGLLFVGAGISGGEEGARHGPSIMPGGDERSWPFIGPLLCAIAAKVDGEPCCDWIGSGGSGHYVKMVHNGIEYGDMQIICEAYDTLTRGLGLDEKRVGEIFKAWNETELKSYLIEITAQILAFCDADQKPFVSSILDVAKQKGTGQWAAVDSLEIGMPLTLIGEAVSARTLSSFKELRQQHSAIFSPTRGGKKIDLPLDREQVVEWLRQALYASKIISYAQGFMLMGQAAIAQKWDLKFGNIAMSWRGGCIIRSRFLGSIRHAFLRQKELPSLLLDPFFADALKTADGGWRRAVQYAAGAGIPVPCFSAALSFYDGICSDRLPANLLQAQRDFFGSHTYERLDRPGQLFHNSWSGNPGQAEQRV